MAREIQQNRAAYGCFLILPLKYDSGSLNRSRLTQLGGPIRMTTMDLNENVKAMLEPPGKAAVGAGYAVDIEALLAPLTAQGAPGPGNAFMVDDGQESFPFEVENSFLYVFHTRVAFLCLSLSFARMEALSAICNPGWAHNGASFSRLGPVGSGRPSRWSDGCRIF